MVYPRQRMVEGRTDGRSNSRSAAEEERGRELAARSRPILAPEEEKKNENELPGDVTTIRRGGDETERLGFHRRAKDPLSVNPGRTGFASILVGFSYLHFPLCNLENIKESGSPASIGL